MPDQALRKERITMEHFDQPQKRRAQFIKPPNPLKAKVGSGGLNEEILEKAQAFLENNSVDFQPLAEMYLKNLSEGIERAKKLSAIDDNEYIISLMLYPGLQLKSNGGMFHYPLVSDIAATLIEFLEVIERPDIEALEIIQAFHTTLQLVVQGKVKGSGGDYGKDLHAALYDACDRYFNKYKNNLKEDAVA